MYNKEWTEAEDEHIKSMDKTHPLRVVDLAEIIFNQGFIKDRTKNAIIQHIYYLRRFRQ